MCATDFGLIGHPLGHSLSPFIHRAILTEAGLTGRYSLYDLEADALDEEVPRLMKQLAGFNCTIPYKETIMRYLSGLEGVARTICSVNTVWRGRGYNTDYQAFQQACPLQAGSPVLILGAGGVSRTMAFAAAAAGCRIWIHARRHEQALQLAAAVRSCYPACMISCPPTLDDWRQAAGADPAGPGAVWTLLNGTPVGLWPKPAAMPLPRADLAWFGQVYDTIYNPVATQLVLAARSLGIPARGGLGMLYDQALAAQKIWHPDHHFPEAMNSRILQQLARAILAQSPLTIILTGFMGSGKTTVGQALAGRLGLPFADLDDLVEQSAGMTIPAIFEREGELSFRRRERQHLEDVLRQSGSRILATGGGTLVQPGIRDLLDRYAVQVVLLDASLAVVLDRVGSGAGRPMLTARTSEGWSALYHERHSQYLAVADLAVPADGPPDQLARTISDKLGLEG